MKLPNKTVNSELKKKFQELFGRTFVFQSIKLFLMDPIYLRSLKSKVKPEYFAIEGTATEDIVRFMLAELEAGNIYTLESIKLAAKDDANGDDAKNLKYGFVFSEVEKVDVENIDDIKKHLEAQLIKLKVAELTNDLNEKLTWDRYQDNPYLLLKRGFKFFLDEMNMDGDDMGTVAEDDLNEALSEESLEWITTGEEMIDKMTGGGAPRRTVAGFIAPTGYGKSTISAMLGFEMAKSGYKVLHIFFEDDKPMIWRKYYSRMTGIPIKEIQGEETKQLIRNHPDYEAVKNNVILVKWDTGLKTVEDVEQLVLSKKYDGFDVDVVIIDYFDCLKMSTNPVKDRLLAEESAMRKLENMAHRRDILVWAMMQANRLATARGNTDGTAQNVEGSKKKKNIAATVIALGKDTENPGYYTFEVDKSRNNGKECIIHRVRFKPGQVQFDWSEADIEFRNVIDSESQPGFDPDLAYKDEPQITVKTPVKDEDFELYLTTD